MAGGQFTSANQRFLLNLFGGACACCGVKNVLIVIDHVRSITPIDGGSPGSHNIENRQPLCVRCNEVKKDRTIDYRTAEQREAIKEHARKWPRAEQLALAL